MRDDDSEHDVRTLWQQSGPVPVHTAPDEIARRARKLDIGVGNLSTQVYVAAFFNVAIWMLIAAITPGTGVRLGAAAGFFGWSYIIIAVMRHRRAMAAAAAAGDAPTLVTYRGMLERQRDFFSVGRVAERAAAMLAGPLGICAAVNAHRDRGAVIVSLFVAFVFIGLMLVGFQGAARQYRSYQRQIDDLS